MISAKPTGFRGFLLMLMLFGVLATQSAIASDLAISSAQTGRKVIGTFRPTTTFEAGEDVWISTVISNYSNQRQSVTLRYRFRFQDGEGDKQSTVLTISAKHDGNKLASFKFTGKGTVSLTLELEDSDGTVVAKKRLSFEIVRR